MQHLTRFIKLGASKLSAFVSGTIKVIARLFGIKQIENNQYDSNQFSSAIWIFILGIPVGLLIIGIDFSITIWLSIVFGILAIVNLDEALMLTALYTEHGVYKKE